MRTKNAIKHFSFVFWDEPDFDPCATIGMEVGLKKWVNCANWASAAEKDRSTCFCCGLGYRLLGGWDIPGNNYLTSNNHRLPDPTLSFKSMELKKHIDQICERYTKQTTAEETLLFQLYSYLQGKRGFHFLKSRIPFYRIKQFR